MRCSTLLLTLAIAATACSGGDTRERRTLVDSRDSYDPRSLDPAFATDVPTGRAVSYLFDGLTRFTEDATLVPGLAERWEVSPDGLVYTFHLRSGVRFHDGAPFTSRHVIATFERVLAPETRAGRVWPLHPIAGAVDYTEGRANSISGVHAPDDLTVVIRLAEPLAVFPKLLAMPVAHIVPDSVAADFGERPVGTGPWRFVEWKHDDFILFARNDDYFDGPPAADSLRARIIPEASTAVAEFESGNVDVLALPENETARWRSNPRLAARLQSVPSLRLWYVAINTGRGPLRDVRVRRALNHSVDVSTILNQLLGARGVPAAGVVPPTLEGADPDRLPYPFDTVAARSLLTDAGFPDGLDLELWHSQDPVFSRVAQSLQGYLAMSGIRVRLVQRDAASVRQAAWRGEVDLYIKDWWADYPDAENFLFPLLHSRNAGSGGNVSFFANPRFDSLVTLSRRTSDQAERVKLYQDADQIAFEEAAMIFLFFSEDLFAVQPWIQGFRIPAIFNGQRWLGVTTGGGTP